MIHLLLKVVGFTALFYTAGSSAPSLFKPKTTTGTTTVVLASKNSTNLSSVAEAASERILTCGGTPHTFVIAPSFVKWPFLSPEDPDPCLSGAVTASKKFRSTFKKLCSGKKPCYLALDVTDAPQCNDSATRDWDGIVLGPDAVAFTFQHDDPINTASVLLHELGHLQGLPHANGIFLRQEYEYGDNRAIMGGGFDGAVCHSPPHAELLGWMAPSRTFKFQTHHTSLWVSSEPILSFYLLLENNVSMRFDHLSEGFG